MFIDIFYWHKVLGYSSQQLHKNNNKNALQKDLNLKDLSKKMCII